MNPRSLGLARWVAPILLVPLLGACQTDALSSLGAGESAADAVVASTAPEGAATAPPTAATSQAPSPSGRPTEAVPAASVTGPVRPTLVATDVQRLDALTLVGRKDFLRGYPPRNPDGTVNAVVEIPAGTNAKWEVKAEDGNLHWDIEDGQPRIVQYLGYPVNYGMVPGTELATEDGGDGDPLDVLLLGEALPRGAVVPVRVIGMLKLIDDGERDDKLIVVRDGTAFAGLTSIRELNETFPGVTPILATWFVNYKGPGALRSGGLGEREEAVAFLEETIDAFDAEPVAMPSE